MFFICTRIQLRSVHCGLQQQQQQQQQQQFYYYLYQKEKYTFAPEIARKLVMAGQAGTRTTLTKTSYHVADT